MHNTQETYNFTTTDFEKITKLTKYCLTHLGEDDYEMIPMRLLPPMYRFKFTCDKAKVWAILNS